MYAVNTPNPHNNVVVVQYDDIFVKAEKNTISKNKKMIKKTMESILKRFLGFTFCIAIFFSLSAAIFTPLLMI
jgi:hypothetical protein